MNHDMLAPFSPVPYLDSYEAVAAYLRDIMDNCNGDVALLLTAVEDAQEALANLLPKEQTK